MMIGNLQLWHLNVQIPHLLVGNIYSARASGEEKGQRGEDRGRNVRQCCPQRGSKHVVSNKLKYRE